MIQKPKAGQIQIYNQIIKFGYRILKQYLVLKLAYKQIIHKKIAYIITTKYASKTDFYFNLFNQNLGENPDNIRYALKLLKSVPCVNDLEIELQYNNLGKYPDSVQQLSVGIATLPLKLEKLALGFINNNIGENSHNINTIAKYLKHIPQSIHTLELWLHSNLIGTNSENMQHLAEGIKRLEKLDLKSFTLGIQNNKLEQNSQNFIFLADCLKSLPNTIESFTLDLQNNYKYGNDSSQNFNYLIQGLKQLPKSLKILRLNVCLTFSKKQSQLQNELKGVTYKVEVQEQGSKYQF